VNSTAIIRDQPSKKLSYIAKTEKPSGTTSRIVKRSISLHKVSARMKALLDHLSLGRLQRIWGFNQKLFVVDHLARPVAGQYLAWLDAEVHPSLREAMGRTLGSAGLSGITDNHCIFSGCPTPTRRALRLAIRISTGIKKINRDKSRALL
jgi:hypothetical protein